ncbi:phosphatases II [Tricholoma matsutake]|nr:phosphatases II [Tricholoma matsutake 945]
MDLEDIMLFGEPNADEIVKGQIFIGNVTGAQSHKLRKELGITHILSVCGEYTSTGDNHLVIPIEDVPCVDILAHLCRACQFIEDALQQGGRILVHCAVGISRSPTVVAAYLMKTRKMGHLNAIRFIKAKRPIVCPNHGFVRQLEVFGHCDYDPPPSQASRQVESCIRGLDEPDHYIR